MQFPRLVSTVALVLAASACSDESEPSTSVNPNQAAGSGGGSNASGSAAGSGGSGGATAPASNGGSNTETPPNPTLSQGGSAATSPGGAAAGAAGTGALPSSDAGAAPPAADAGADTGMSFFVTSRGSGDGGNFGGIAGADALCQTLATEADPALASKTWRAYLSTSSESARNRIGTGPWRNAAGAVIANDVEQLHDQAAGGTLDATWPVNDFGVPLDETGAQVPQNVHDILTGSQQDGTVAVDGMGNSLTCNDWTSNAGGTAQIGHSNRAGLAGQPPSWNAVHAVGCGAITAGQNFAGGTVSQGGGRGSIYCFAID